MNVVENQLAESLETDASNQRKTDYPDLSEQCISDYEKKALLHAFMKKATWTATDGTTCTEEWFSTKKIATLLGIRSCNDWQVNLSEALGLIRGDGLEWDGVIVSQEEYAALDCGYASETSSRDISRFDLTCIASFFGYPISTISRLQRNGTLPGDWRFSIDLKDTLHIVRYIMHSVRAQRFDLDLWRAKGVVEGLVAVSDKHDYRAAISNPGAVGDSFGWQIECQVYKVHAELFKRSAELAIGIDSARSKLQIKNSTIELKNRHAERVPGWSPSALPVFLFLFGVNRAETQSSR